MDDHDDCPVTVGDTYQASVRLRSAVVANRPPIDAFVRFSPAGWLTLKPLAGGRVSCWPSETPWDTTEVARRLGVHPLTTVEQVLREKAALPAG